MLFAEIITWDVPSRVRRKDVWQALADVGLPPKLLPDMTERQAASRASSALKDKRLQVDRLPSAGRIEYQLTDRSVTDHRIDFFPRTTVVVDQWAAKLVTGSMRDAEQFEKAMGEAMTWITGADVSRVVARAFDEHAALFPVVPKKGVVYVVPVQYQELVMRVESFLSQIGGRLHKFPVPRDSEGESSVKDAITAGVQGMIEELQEAVTEWDVTTRNSTQEAARTRWATIQAKIKEYDEYVQGNRGVLEAMLGAARQRIEDRVLELAGIKEAESAVRAAAASLSAGADEGVPGPVLGATA